jgi:hypothetical protein
VARDGETIRDIRLNSARPNEMFDQRSLQSGQIDRNLSRAQSGSPMAIRLRSALFEYATGQEIVRYSPRFPDFAPLPIFRRPLAARFSMAACSRQVVSVTRHF